MLTPSRMSAPTHATDRRTPDLHTSRDNHGVNERSTSSAASLALSGYRVPWSILTSPLLFGLLAVVVALVAWKIPLSRLSHLMTAMVFLIVLNFARAIGVHGGDGPSVSLRPARALRHRVRTA